MASKAKILAAKGGACEDCGGTIYEIETDLGIQSNVLVARQVLKNQDIKLLDFQISLIMK